MRHLHWSPTGRPRRRSIWLSLTLCLALSGGVAVVLPGRAHAATVIVSTCTESALDTAVAAANPGDTVQFGCSGTITLTKTLNITVNLTLEGRGQNVILDGNHSVQVLSVSNGINFTLDHLTVADGMSVGTQGGATAAGGGLFNYGGTITLTNCAFTGDTAQGANGANDAGGHAGGNGGDAFGGAVDIEIGTLTVTNCTITGNTARGGNGGNGGNNSPVGGTGGDGGNALGGAIDVSDGAITVANSTFTGNLTQGGASGNGGDSAVSGGSSGNGGYGAGDLYVTQSAGGTVAITNSSFTDNTVAGGAGGSGGTGDSGAGGNGGQGGPGQGVVSGAGPTIANSSFAGNSALGGAGGAGGSSISGTGGSGGHGGTGEGGGLIGAGTITNSTVAGNTAQGGAAGAGGNSSSGTGGYGGVGGDSFGGGLEAYATKLTNTTFAGNSANGGAAGPGGTGGSSNGGSGVAGSGQGNSVYVIIATLQIANSILSSGSGTNCAPGSSANHSLSNTDPMLGPLANNGGPAQTQTMALLPGSPAIDAGGTSANGCPATDQRGAGRPQGPACDIGAYEFGPAQPPGPPLHHASASITTRPTASPNPGWLGQTVQLCAIVASSAGMQGLPGGSVSFQDGATMLGTAALTTSGSACFSTNTLGVGTHSITASYGGDASFKPSASAPLVLTIGASSQDVKGTSAGTGSSGATNGNSAATNSSRATNSNGAATGSSQVNVASQQNPATTTSAHAASVARRTPARSSSPGLATGAGIVLVLLVLGGLGAVLYRARRLARG